MARPEYFLDTSYAVALAVTADTHHAAALDIALRLKSESAALLTTKPVLYEIGNSLSRNRFREASVELIESLLCDSNVGVLDDTPKRFQSALELYRRRPDKEWGLTDCLSFVVMAEHGLTVALTADVHFEQAGFRALLRQTAP